jgi:hypothetical protein
MQKFRRILNGHLLTQRQHKAGETATTIAFPLHKGKMYPADLTAFLALDPVSGQV